MGIIGALRRTIIVEPPLPPTKSGIICEHDRGVTPCERTEGGGEDQDCRWSTCPRLRSYTLHRVMVKLTQEYLIFLSWIGGRAVCPRFDYKKKKYNSRSSLLG